MLTNKYFKKEYSQTKLKLNDGDDNDEDDDDENDDDEDDDNGYDDDNMWCPVNNIKHWKMSGFQEWTWLTLQPIYISFGLSQKVDVFDPPLCNSYQVPNI